MAELIHTASGIVFTTRSARNKRGKRYLIDEQGRSFLEADCRPLDLESPLAGAEIDTLTAMIHAMVEEQDPTDLKLIGSLTPAQKAQVWERLSPAARSEVAELAREAA